MSQIDDKYTQLGGAGSFLGQPSSPEQSCPDGVGHFRHYAHGSIYYHPSTGAHEVHGAIHDRWKALGWERSWLGYPTSDEIAVGNQGARRSRFQNGQIDWSASTGAIDKSDITFSAYHGKDGAFHQAEFDKRYPAWRIASLSVYGDPGDPRYACVWVKEAGPSYSARHGISAADYQAYVDASVKKGLGVALVSATGSGPGAVFAAVMEQMEPGSWVAKHGLKKGDLNNPTDPAAFPYWNRWAKENHFILSSFALYGDSGNPLIAATWRPNTENVAWNADSLCTTASEEQTRFTVQTGHNARPGYVTRSDYERLIELYRSDAIGPWVSRANLTASEYQAEFDKQVPQGFYPAVVQGSGTGSDTRFAVLFAKRLSPLPSQMIVTGQPVPAMSIVDEQVQGFMQRNNIPNGSVAISKNGKLVYARAFTWGPPGAVITQPTHLFRIASCSKPITAILICRLIQEGKLSLNDTVQSVLGITPPSGMSVGNDKFSQIKIWHLLSHVSGVATQIDVHDQEIVKAFNHQLPANDKMEAARFMMTLAKSHDPATVEEYANAGFFLLAAVVEKRFGMPYEQALKQALLSPLGLTRPRVTSMDLKNLGLGEIPQYDWDLWIGQSIMDPNRPLVANDYGSRNLKLADGFGGLAFAPADYVKVMAAMGLGGASNPVLTNDTVSKVMWSKPKPEEFSGGGFSRGWITWTVKDGVQEHGHDGGLATTQTRIFYRTDGYAVAAFFGKGARDHEPMPDFHDLLDGIPSWPMNDLFTSVGIPAF